MIEGIQNCLGKCKFPNRCTCDPKIEVVETSMNLFRVYDPPPELQQPCRIVAEKHEYQLTVENNAAKDVYFFKTDKCLVGEDIQKCDCIIGNNEKIFFVEIKSCSSGVRSTKRKEAVLQLGSMIEKLKGEGINFQEIIAKAIICFKHSNERPIKASLNSQRAIFLQSHNVLLEEGNLITF